MARPLFIAGKTYAIIIRPGPSFETLTFRLDHLVGAIVVRGFDIATRDGGA
jgi:hypothetical protein